MLETWDSKTDVSNGTAFRERRQALKSIGQKSIAVTFLLLLLVMPSGLCSQQQLPIYQAALDLKLVRSETFRRVSDQHAGEVSVSRTPPPQSSTSHKIADATAQRPFHNIILQAAKTYQVDPALIKAIIMAESNYNPLAVSSQGAQGLMQLMPDTAKWLGVADAFDPTLNINGGVRYFRYLLDRFKGDVEMALAAYNAGILHVVKHDGIPPFEATQSYVKKVLEYHHRYQREMAAYGLDSSNA